MKPNLDTLNGGLDSICGMTDSPVILAFILGLSVGMAIFVIASLTGNFVPRTSTYTPRQPERTPGAPGSGGDF